MFDKLLLFLIFSDQVMNEITVDHPSIRVTSYQEHVLAGTAIVNENASSADAIPNANEVKMDTSVFDPEDDVDNQAVDFAPEYSSPDVWPEVNEAAYALVSAPASREEQLDREKASSSEQSIRIPTSESKTRSNGKESDHDSVIRKMLDDKNVQSPAPPPPSPELKGPKKVSADSTQAKSHDSLAMEPLYEETGEVADSSTPAPPDAGPPVEEDPGVMTHVSHVAPLGQSHRGNEMTDHSFVNVDIPAEMRPESGKTNGDGTVRSSIKSDTDGTTYRSNIPSSAGVSAAGYITERTLTGELASDECEDSSPDPLVKGKTVPAGKPSDESVSQGVLPEASKRVVLEDSESTTDTEKIMEPRPGNAPRENASDESELIMAEPDLIRTSTDTSARNDVIEDDEGKQLQDCDAVHTNHSQSKPDTEKISTNDQKEEEIPAEDNKKEVEVEAAEAEDNAPTVEEVT